MTGEAYDDRPSVDQSRSETRILLVIIWITAVFSLTMSFGFNSLSPDDAMRLVQVRDLLAGQSWFDLTQYRLAPPQGVVTHWSRLVDLPLALLIGLFKLVMPQAAAEKATLVLWPTLLLLGYLAGVTQIARALAGETAARIALLFAVLMAPVLQHFRIDSIHHHNVQIVLITWTLALLLRGSPRGAALAGLTSALSIAVGAEMAPVVAVLAVVVAAHWIVAGDARARATMAYGIALGSSVPFLMIATVPPAAYMTVHCDSLSIAQTGALAIGGFGLAAIATLRLSLTMRITAAAGLALLLGLGIMASAPRCLADPYAQLDPRLAALWLTSVSEARSAVAMLRDLPHQVPAYIGVPLAALAARLRLLPAHKRARALELDCRCRRTTDFCRHRTVAGARHSRRQRDRGRTVSSRTHRLPPGPHGEAVALRSQPWRACRAAIDQSRGPSGNRRRRRARHRHRHTAIRHQR